MITPSQFDSHLITMRFVVLGLLSFCLVQAVKPYGHKDMPGFIKGALGYRGNLMIFQANASFHNKQTNDCRQTFRSIEHAFIGSIQWKCDEGADLVIGTRFSKGQYVSPSYHAYMFPALLWIPLTYTMNPMRFKLDVDATLHVYLSRFSKVSWDKPIGLHIDQEDYLSMNVAGHYTFDLKPGIHMLDVDTFPGLDFEASGIYVTENKNKNVYV